MIALACGIGCNGGPTSDYPNAGGPVGSPGGTMFPSSPGAGGTGNGNDTGGSPGGSNEPPGSSGQAGGGATVGGGFTGGGGPGGATPGTPGGVTGGSVGGAGGTTGAPGGGLLGGGTAGGGFIGGSSASDAGSGGPDAGAPNAADMDGGLPDAGPDAAGPIDGGDTAVPEAGLCPTDSLARIDGGCRGSYCGMTFDGLADAAASGACSADGALRLACDGELARKAAQCAQEHALSLALGSAVRSCLQRDVQLRDVEGECVDCYVSELLCTLTSCLATCVADLESACTSCRREHCGAAFQRCSGLPAL